MSSSRPGAFLEVLRGLGEPAVIPLQPGQELPPMSVGRRGMWRVDGAKGVLDVHAYLFFDGEELFLQSADGASPAIADGQPIGTEWTPIEQSCEILLGAVALRYHAPERGTGPSSSNEERTAFYTPPPTAPQWRGPQGPVVNPGPPPDPGARSRAQVGGPAQAASTRPPAPPGAPQFRPHDSESTRIRPFEPPANPSSADFDEGMPSSGGDQTLVHQGARQPAQAPGATASQRPAAGRPAAGRPPEPRLYSHVPVGPAQPAMNRPSAAPPFGAAHGYPSGYPAGPGQRATQQQGGPQHPGQGPGFALHNQGAPPALLSVSDYIDEASAVPDSQGALMNATIAGPLEMMMPHLQMLQRSDASQGSAAGLMQNAPYAGPQTAQPFAGGYTGAQGMPPGGGYPQPYGGPTQGQGAPYGGPSQSFSGAPHAMPPGDRASGNPAPGFPGQPYGGGFAPPVNVLVPNAPPRRWSWAWFRGEWSRTSFPKKVILFLSPALMWGVLHVFDDPPAPATVPLASVLTAASTAVPTAPPVLTQAMTAPTPPEPPSPAVSTAAPEPPSPAVSTAPTITATVQASASIASTAKAVAPAKTAATPKHAPPPSNSTDEKNTDARSLERQAVDAVANSQFEEAGRLYDDLARKDPTNKVFATAARVMHGKAHAH